MTMPWFQRLRDLLCFAGHGPLALEEALPRLLPKVRPRFLHEALALDTGRPGPLFQPLAGPLAVSLVVDLETAQVDLGAADLARWDAGFEPLLQRARANLASRSALEDFQAAGPGRYLSTWRDGLDGSRALLPGLLRGLPLSGDPVVLLPSPNTLLVTGADDPEGLEWALAGMVGSLDEDPRAFHGCPLRLRGYQWEPFQADGQRLCPLLSLLGHRRLLDEYASQKRLLDRRHGRAGTAVTVAPFQLEPAADGPARSFTVWSQAMGEAWLPRADQVRLDLERGRAWVPWERLEARLGALLEPVGLFPERYRFTAPPDPKLLEGLML